MKRTIIILATLIVAVLWMGRARAQGGAQCDGDFDDDGRVSIDELVTAVNNALTDCNPTTAQRQGCLDSGGTVSAGLCCSTAPDFPDSCTIGSCGCAPQSSRDVLLCECGEGECFSRGTNACIVR